LAAVPFQSPSLTFDESIFGTLHTLRDPIVFAHANFGENILIAMDMPPECNSKKAPWGRNSTSGFKVDAFTRLGTYVCIIMHDFSEIGQSSAELWRFK